MKNTPKTHNIIIEGPFVNKNKKDHYLFQFQARIGHICAHLTITQQEILKCAKEEDDPETFATYLAGKIKHAATKAITMYGNYVEKIIEKPTISFNILKTMPESVEPNTLTEKTMQLLIAITEYFEKCEVFEVVPTDDDK